MSSTPPKHRSRWRLSSRNSYIIFKIKCFSMSKNIFDVFRWAIFPVRIKNITICSWVSKKITQTTRFSTVWSRMIWVRLRVSESRPQYDFILFWRKLLIFSSPINSIRNVFYQRAHIDIVMAEERHKGHYLFLFDLYLNYKILNVILCFKTK